MKLQIAFFAVALAALVGCSAESGEPGAGSGSSALTTDFGDSQATTVQTPDALATQLFVDGNVVAELHAERDGAQTVAELDVPGVEYPRLHMASDTINPERANQVLHSAWLEASLASEGKQMAKSPPPCGANCTQQEMCLGGVWCCLIGYGFESDGYCRHYLGD